MGCKYVFFIAVSCLLNHYFFTIIYIDATLGRLLAIELASVDGVPDIVGIRGIREIRGYNSRCVIVVALAVAEVELEGTDAGLIGIGRLAGGEALQLEVAAEGVHLKVSGRGIV